MNDILSLECEDRSGRHTYTVRMLYELGVVYDLTADVVVDIWRNMQRHDALFGDDTPRDVDTLMALIYDPRAIWMEVTNESGEQTGLVYFTDVIPGYDVKGHFTFWDSIASGREELLLDTMRYMMHRYQLVRITAEVPPFQAGVIRYIKRLGFKPEGERRKSVKHKGKWMPLMLFGILNDELEAV